MGTTGSTFSHIFGANTTPFELLVVKRKIMGPCWLEIKEATLSTKSVCKKLVLPSIAVLIILGIMVQDRVLSSRSQKC